MDPIFTFKRLEVTDLDILCEWFNKKRVKEWWNDNLTNEEIKSKYSARINNNSYIHPFIAYLGDLPIGFIQYYQANKVDNDWWPDEMENTLGTDQFIGREDYINRGYGTQMIGQFLAKLFAETDAKKIITDVDENNHRAIRCYEKLGFFFSHKVKTPEGLANIMNRYKNTSIEPHAYILKKPNEGIMLYKIVSYQNFIDMVKNNYLYFRRVDTYCDDKRDSDQPDKDKKITDKSKFENAIDYTAKNYYDSSRSKTYACCFSTENSRHLWDNYGENNTNAICLVFDCHKLINFLNLNYDQARIIFNNRRLINFFNINHGLVAYGSFDNTFLKQHLPNPIEYVYFKDATKYAEENEFRISLSCLGLCKYVLPDGTEFTFPDSLNLSFDFSEAIKRNILQKIIVCDKSNHKEKIKNDLNKIFEDKGVTCVFV